MSDDASQGISRHVFHPKSLIPHPSSFIRLLLISFLCVSSFGCRPTSEAPDGSNPDVLPPPPRTTVRGRSTPDTHRVDAAAKRQSLINSQQSTINNLPHSSDWPVFRGNAEATGVAGGGLPTKLDVLWTFPITKGGFESTAAIVGGVVYIGSTDGNLYALDLATGEKRWQFPTPLGFTASAAVQGGRVYIGDSDGTFYCIDAATGRKLWHYQTDGEIDSSANFHAGHVLFGSQDSFLYCLDAVSGKLVWKYQSPDQIRCFPAVAGDRGFVAGCDGRLHVIDLKNGAGVGEVKIDSPTGSSPAVMGGTVFVGTEGNNFFAIDPQRRKVLWRKERSKHAAAFRSSAAATPEAVIVGSRDRQLHAFNPKTGNPLWSFTTKGLVDSSPVVVGDRVFVGSRDGRLYAIDVKTGAKQWQFDAGGAVVASPAVADGRLVIGNDSGQLYCFGAK